MTQELPAPLVPADVDHSDFKFMPLDVRRLRDSRLAATVSGDGFRAAILLWCAAWHQKPAASLPDDDVELAQLAGYGRVVKEWRKVRTEALYGFVRCSDGRWYHPVVAEKALDSWHGKTLAAWEKECDRIRKENKKRAEKEMEPLGFPPRPQRNSVAGVYGIPPESPPISAGIPPENTLKGQGQGQGQGEEERIPPPSEAHPPPPADPPFAPPVGTEITDLPSNLQRGDVGEAVTLWNAMAACAGLPTVQRVTDTRRRAVRARLAECGGIDGWKVALGKVETSAFLCGDNDRGWKADFDFLLQAKSFTKLMEGAYDRERAGSGRQAINPIDAGLARSLGRG